MAPLAGKPPFATDEPDSFYETPRAPQPRLRQPKPADPNQRTSAYDVYNNYLKEDASKLAAPAATETSNRNSGIGAMLLNMGDDDSDDDSDDDDASYRRRPAAPPGINVPLSKNAALAAATGVSTPTTPTFPNAPPQVMQAGSPRQARSPAAQPGPVPQQMQQQQRQQQPPQQQRAPQFPAPPPNQQQQPAQMQQRPPQAQPIAAPRPGYPAPIAALNLARPEQAKAPAGRQGPPAPIQIPSNTRPFGGPAFPMPASPAPSTPHPLLPPVTPITPAFIRPTKSPAPVNVSFAGVDAGDAEGKAVPRKPIMRGNSEETLLPSRGEKGDDFWRRFSMVVKEESKKGTKESSWLLQTNSGLKRHSRWVWIIGVLLLILIAGGAGTGYYFTRNSPGHQQPTAIGGSADNLATAVGPSSTAAGGAAAAAAGAGASTSSPHVSPTLTVARREAEAVVTPRAVPIEVVRRHRELLKNREMGSW